MPETSDPAEAEPAAEPVDYKPPAYPTEADDDDWPEPPEASGHNPYRYPFL